jgi:hypothetical protein
MPVDNINKRLSLFFLRTHVCSSSYSCYWNFINNKYNLIIVQTCQFLIVDISFSVDIPHCRHFPISTFFRVDIFFCRHFFLSTFRTVDILFSIDILHRRHFLSVDILHCRRSELSTFSYIDIFPCRHFFSVDICFSTYFSRHFIVDIFLSTFCHFPTLTKVSVIKDFYN